jgi:hypothetical protein
MLGKKLCGMFVLGVALASSKIVSDSHLDTKTSVIPKEDLPKSQLKSTKPKLSTIDTSNNDIVSPSINILTTAGSNSNHPVSTSSTNNIANAINQEDSLQQNGNSLKTKSVNTVETHN